MYLSNPCNLVLHHKPHRCVTASISAALLDPGLKIVAEANTGHLSFEGTKERIKKMFDRIELSVSSYDTAWVAMVPSSESPHAPCFPECVNWVLNNQLHDGSWGFPQRHPLLIKDGLSSTLACVLALKRWGVGEEQMNKGIHFIESNVSSAKDEKQHSPIGFDIIFPGMVTYAKDLNLNLPLPPADVESMLRKRDLELQRGPGSKSEGMNAYLAYVSEGMGQLQDWEMVMKHQRKNGSLFNSPSTTAAALIHSQNAGCLSYLHSLLNTYPNAVPTIYPLDVYTRLCMIDDLIRLGIDRHFKKEIRNVLDETYRCWLQREEELFLDITTCAMAFRILRVYGYSVSSGPLNQFEEACHYFDSFEGHLKDTGPVLELFRASQIMIYPDESALEKTHSWSSHFLRQGLSSGSINSNRLGKYFGQQGDDALKFPYYANLERLENRRYMEHYDVGNTRILKTSYSSLNFGNGDFLRLAVEDFNLCQSIHCKELKHLGRWIVENKLDKLKFARQKLAYCYFSAAATLFPPEVSDARISWAKNGILTTVVDDFFDVGGSEEELVNLIKLVEKWDVNIGTDCCSEQVEIIFSALHSTICEIGDKAFKWQARNVMSHVKEIWLNLLKSMMKEADWTKDKTVPTIDEYITNAYVSFALGPIVLPALYLVGPKLTEEDVKNPEFPNLFKLMSTCGRLLNDIRGFERESKEGKLNAVSLYMIHGKGTITEEEAVEELKSIIESSRRELLRLVLQEKDSMVPRACKDLFWKMCKVVHLFYMKDDGFTSHEMINAANAVLQESIVLKDF